MYPIAPKILSPYLFTNLPPWLKGAELTHTAVFPIPNATSSNHINVVPYSVLYHKSPLLGDPGASLPILTLPLPPPPPAIQTVAIPTEVLNKTSLTPRPMKFNCVKPYPTNPLAPSPSLPVLPIPIPRPVS